MFQRVVLTAGRGRHSLSCERSSSPRYQRRERAAQPAHLRSKAYRFRMWDVSEGSFMFQRFVA